MAVLPSNAIAVVPFLTAPMLNFFFVADHLQWLNAEPSSSGTSRAANGPILPANRCRFTTCAIRNPEMDSAGSQRVNSPCLLPAQTNMDSDALGYSSADPRTTSFSTPFDDV